MGYLTAVELLIVENGIIITYPSKVSYSAQKKEQKLVHPIKAACCIVTLALTAIVFVHTNSF